MEAWVTVLVGAVVASYGALGQVAYRHVMDAFEKSENRDAALAKRILFYESRNNEKHEELISRLSHVEALVNGKERTR